MSCWASYGFDILKTLLTLFAGAIITLKIVNLRKASEDFLEKRIDDLCADIRSVSELAANYWLKEGDVAEIQPLAAQIQARQLGIEVMRAAISRRNPELNNKEVIEASAAFFRDATGGDFGVHNRAKSIAAARAVHSSAGHYIIAIRRVRMEKLKR